MIIKRNVNGTEMEFELTDKELGKAHDEFVTNWMASELFNAFGLTVTEAEECAELAYDLYCEGNGKTEYECIEDAFEEYEKRLEYN